MYRVAVDGDDVADQLTEIDPELARRRAIYNAQAQPAAALDAHDLWIGERPIVRQEGVVVDIVQVHSHIARAHGRSRPAHLGHGHGGRQAIRACTGLRRIGARATTVSLDRVRRGLRCCTRPDKTGEHLLRRSEGEVVQHEDDVLPIFATVGAVDDERRGHQTLLLQALMRMHPVRAWDRLIVA
jgi:hypothetical protein